MWIGKARAARVRLYVGCEDMEEVTQSSPADQLKLPVHVLATHILDDAVADRRADQLQARA